MSHHVHRHERRLTRRIGMVLGALVLALPPVLPASAQQVNGCESFIRIVQSPPHPFDGDVGTVVVEYGEITDVEPACFSAGSPSNFNFSINGQDRSAYFSHALSPDGTYTIAT